ncbi:hypothetical protein JCM19992_04110 [Thermostilla marina]
MLGRTSPASAGRTTASILTKATSTNGTVFVVFPIISVYSSNGPAESVLGFACFIITAVSRQIHEIDRFDVPTPIEIARRLGQICWIAHDEGRPSQ